jgi:predicted nucleic acid-binding Zn ribbon protein
MTRRLTMNGQRKRRDDFMLILFDFGNMAMAWVVLVIVLIHVFDLSRRFEHKS